MDLWSLFGSVSQGSLKSCRLLFDDRPVDDASLFPMFDDRGETRVVMITAGEDARILLARWVPGLFGRDWLGRNRLGVRFTDRRDASVWEADRFEDLWHVDPWWVLNAERFQGHGAVPGLRNTNLPGYDTAVAGAAFSADLARVTYIMRKSGDSASVRRFRPDTLAVFARRRRAARVRPRAAAVAGWRLRPFWGAR